MDFTELIKTAINNGIWAVLSISLIKYFIDDKASTINLLNKNHKETTDDMKCDKETLMDIVIGQKELLSQMKDILARQTDMLSKNADTMDSLKIAINKIADVQIRQEERLEKIETRVETIEKQTTK